MNQKTDEEAAKVTAVGLTSETALAETVKGIAVAGQARMRPSRIAKWLMLLLLAGIALVVELQPPASAMAAFPGVNGKIAFSSLRDGNYEIYVMNADGSGQTDLTNRPGQDLHPDWSADGAKIAFVNRSGVNGDYEVYVMNADGSGQTNLTNNPADDRWPAWSPDGAKIVFVRTHDALLMKPKYHFLHN